MNLECLLQDPFIYTFVLKPVPAALPLAREVTATALEFWHAPEETRESAKLITSELVTNAIAAAPPGTLVALRVYLSDSGAPTIEVWDDSPHPPTPKSLTPDQEDGRGLQIVEALSKSWGHTRLPTGGKYTWSELPPPD